VAWLYFRKIRKFRGISSSRLARAWKCPCVTSELLKAYRSTTATPVLLFKIVLGIIEGSLTKMQVWYRMYSVRHDRHLLERIKDIGRAAAVL
jgi:hypothetical protein